ncbi:DUF4352 domain-containing protein [Thalassobacillus devorans]|uniref:DUF4352 domain-containing protein n=1 Tax=Thalassobacillus devorans TaxID=279813 RepID=UPI000490B2E3|nr:DUF4352 domain-containing protein [Thalassobacillus devorans]
MKHLLYLLMAVVLLTACTNANKEIENAKEQPEKDTEIAKKETDEQEAKNQATFIDNPQAPDDSSLKKTGQTYQDGDGKIKLLALSPSEKQVTVGPMEMIIKEVKLMNYSPAPHLIDFFHGYTSQEENFNYIKLNLIVKNTSNQTLNFAPVSVLETNKGEKKNFEDDFYLENMYGKYKSGETRYGQLGFIIKKNKTKKIDSLQILTSDVFSGKESIDKAKKITIQLSR